MNEMHDEYEAKHLSEENDTKPTFLSNGVYDVLKFLALIVLPAMGALYFTLAEIWGLPKAQEVVGTIVAIDTFIGVVLGISSHNYSQAVQGPVVGSIDVVETPEKKKFSLDFPGDPEDIVNHDRVTFKVRHKP